MVYLKLIPKINKIIINPIINKIPHMGRVEDIDSSHYYHNSHNYHNLHNSHLDRSERCNIDLIGEFSELCKICDLGELCASPLWMTYNKMNLGGDINETN